MADNKSLIEKINKVKDAAMVMVGKDGHNPYQWIVNNVHPLEVKVLRGEVTKEVEAAINALPEKPDTRVSLQPDAPKPAPEIKLKQTVEPKA